MLALQTPQMILMVLSFGAMSLSVGIALWLWLRQRKPTRASPQLEGHTSTRVVLPPPTPTAVPASVPPPPADDATELVALPHLRERDAPGSQPEGTEIIAVSPPVRERPSPPERTEFVAPPPERTEMFVAEKTEFIPAPLAPHAEKTEFIPAPLAPRAPVPVPAPMPTPMPTPESRSSTAETSARIDLAEHLRLAIDAFEQLQTGTSTPALAGHLDVLASVPADALLELIRPMLESCEGHRFAGALLALLHSKTWPAKTAFGPLLAELDDARKQTALALLRSWDDSRARSIATSSLGSASDLDSRISWLGCFAERGWDPGVAMIEAALTDPDPRIVALGLRLLPRSDAAARLQTKLAGSLFASDPNVRIQAIEAALAFGDHSAWLVCRQLARNPSFPVAAQLVGLLGTEAEITEQCRAFEAAPTPELLAGLGLSGRPVVLRACVERFDDADPKLREAARAALALAAGSSFEAVAPARSWLDSQKHARLLGGALRSATQVLRQLAIADPPTRRALARELGIRSRGRVHVDPSLLAWAFARQLEELEPQLATIDFDRGALVQAS